MIHYVVDFTKTSSNSRYVTLLLDWGFSNTESDSPEMCCCDSFEITVTHQKWAGFRKVMKSCLFIGVDYLSGMKPDETISRWIVEFPLDMKVDGVINPIDFRIMARRCSAMSRLGDPNASDVFSFLTAERRKYLRTGRSYLLGLCSNREV